MKQSPESFAAEMVSNVIILYMYAIIQYGQ